MSELLRTTNIRNCARCDGDHDQLVFKKLSRPFAPREAAPIEWTHWAPCPTNGEPILMRVEEDRTVRIKANGCPVPAHAADCDCGGMGGSR